MFYFARFRWLLRPDIARDKPNPISVASASNPGVPAGTAEATRLKRVLGAEDVVNPKRNVVLATPLLFDYKKKLKSHEPGARKN